MEDYVKKICVNAKSAKKDLNKLSSIERNRILVDIGEKLITNKLEILEANKKDVDIARDNNLKDSFIERLIIDEKKIQYMADTLFNISKLEEVLSQYDSMKTLENGLVVGKKTVPIGVVLIIFESRPNVTVDSFGLCFKTGNVSILRGGKEAINTTKSIVRVIKDVLIKNGINEDIVTLVTKTDREIVPILTKQNKYIDVVIPRGSDSLITAVVENSTVPVIETGVGNCHVYVDKYADFEKAINIVNNAKTQRVSVCNSMETLLIDEDVYEEFLPRLVPILDKSNIQYRCCEKSLNVIKTGLKATNQDYATEFLDYILAVKVVKGVEEALEHISEYSTGHSESIITENYTNAQRFLNDIDSACVYVNASTRFTDGDMFGFGGEIGISTQKLHARGPMGLKELTTYKYVIYGNGQIRE